MTKAVTLESKVELFRDLLYQDDFGNYQSGIPDVTVMVKLGCTPQSWSRYRPQIAQYCLFNDPLEPGKDSEVRISMRYDKRAKMWYGRPIKDNSLI